MADRSSSPDASHRHPTTAALAVLLAITLVAALLLGWFWYTRHAPLFYDLGPAPTIADAERARFALPIIFGGVALIALTWLLTWRLARWTFTTLPLAIGCIGAVALLACAVQGWMSASATQGIAIVTYLCEPGSARLGPGQSGLPDGCEVVPTGDTMTIGTIDDPTRVRSDSTSGTDSAGGLTRFPDLPPGTYDALLTVTITRPDTAEAILAVDTVAGVRSIAPLAQGEDETWSSRIALHPDLAAYALLLYPSPHEAMPDARITVTLRECRTTSPADLDPAACEPPGFDSPILEEAPVAEEAPGRPPLVSIEGDTMTMANLEARAYTLVPTADLAVMLGETPTMLITPADAPQTRENSIVQPGGSPFGSATIEIDEATGTLEYIVYIFAESQTVAHAPEPSRDMRP